MNNVWPNIGNNATVETLTVQLEQPPLDEAVEQGFSPQSFLNPFVSWDQLFQDYAGPRPFSEMEGKNDADRQANQAEALHETYKQNITDALERLGPTLQVPQ
jgi:hypothetical protein